MLGDGGEEKARDETWAKHNLSASFCTTGRFMFQVSLYLDGCSEAGTMSLEHGRSMLLIRLFIALNNKRATVLYTKRFK